VRPFVDATASLPNLFPVEMEHYFHLEDCVQPFVDASASLPNHVFTFFSC